MRLAKFVRDVCVEPTSVGAELNSIGKNLYRFSYQGTLLDRGIFGTPEQAKALGRQIAAVNGWNERELIVHKTI